MSFLSVPNPIKYIILKSAMVAGHQVCIGFGKYTSAILSGQLSVSRVLSHQIPVVLEVRLMCLGPFHDVWLYRVCAFHKVCASNTNFSLRYSHIKSVSTTSIAVGNCHFLLPIRRHNNKSVCDRKPNQCVFLGKVCVL